MCLQLRKSFTLTRRRAADVVGSGVRGAEETTRRLIHCSVRRCRLRLSTASVRRAGDVATDCRRSCCPMPLRRSTPPLLPLLILLLLLLLLLALQCSPVMLSARRRVDDAKTFLKHFSDCYYMCRQHN